MHLVWIIAAGVFLAMLGICLAPVVAGFLVIVGAFFLALGIAFMEWLSDKLTARSRRKVRIKSLQDLQKAREERFKQ